MSALLLSANVSAVWKGMMGRLRAAVYGPILNMGVGTGGLRIFVHLSYAATAQNLLLLCSLCIKFHCLFPSLHLFPFLLQLKKKKKKNPLEIITENYSDCSVIGSTGHTHSSSISNLSAINLGQKSRVGGSVVHTRRMSLWKPAARRRRTENK